ncbi:LOW QUALITY PROTEIN: hypothetical protein CVT26_007602 [Gymnopilus dilepis]|uniref:FAD-binding PCMH-type domain-containing protein n=1 Tax=Gymnopilus dilepis TaxID=231916 RepID=A0A409W847_9AGAR|nr:LOW QUALITY PROTEIN: hypothetical protein CVT26_007602 [Gymnopilus dilepis]
MLAMFSSLAPPLLFLATGLASAKGVRSQDWNTLNRTVGGRLQVGVPLAQPCFSRPTPYNVAQCLDVQSNYADHVYRSDNFGAYEIAQWETCQTTGDDCLLDWTNTSNPAAFLPPSQCKQGSIPSYYIDVTGPNDVIAAYNFANQYQVPLVIKNTGHDYIGRSSAPGSLALWTHNLDKLVLNNSFVPEGCSVPPTTAVTAGAGQQFNNIFGFAVANNVTIVSGADPGVGLSGGWVMGGGHSALSPALGLGVDRVLQFKIVTPDGQYRTVNKCQNQDLFFALRGGGGGTFGVVLESTHLASPPVTLQVVLGLSTFTPANATKLIQGLAASAVQMAADGWGGYITPSSGNAVWANPLLDSTAAQESAAGVVEAFAAVGGTTVFMTMDSYTDFFNAFIASNTDPVGRPQVVASRLIPDTSFGNDSLFEDMANAMLGADFGQILAVTPYAFKDYDRNGTSINPAFRTAVWHSIMGYYWNYNATSTQRVNAYKQLEQQWAPVRAQTPGAAVYQNEADVYEPDYTNAFWGSDNYNKLLSIKRKYDPHHLLDCWHCVSLTAAWPGSSPDWNSLNQTVSGRLQAGVPFSQPCFSRLGGGAPNTPDPAQCSAIQANYADHVFRSDHFGAYEITQWETCQTTGDECLLDWTNTSNPKAFQPPAQCRQGSVPNYYIDVTGPNDVIAAFSFSKKNSVPLVVKNTGHDYIGRSAAPGSLALWVRNNLMIRLPLTELLLFRNDRRTTLTSLFICFGTGYLMNHTVGPEPQLRPKRVPTRDEADDSHYRREQAGQQFEAIYSFAGANNVTVVAGADPGVGISGGWAMGGGHSGLSPSLGLGVDRVLEFKIVTPDGQYRTANKCQNTDLFFALRGGGGGTFGVVLESTHIASPQVTIQAVLGLYNATQENSIKLIKALAKSAVQLAGDGWGGYITPALASAVWANPLLNSTAAQQSAAGVVEAFASVGGSTTFFTMDSYTEFFDTFIAPNTDSSGRPQVLASRLIPSNKFTDDTLIDAIANGVVNSDFGQILAVTPFAYKGFDPNGTSINPGWRTAVWHSLLSYYWNYDSTLSQRVGLYNKLEQQWAVVRQRTPGAAVYFNEADVYEPNYIDAYWGASNYAKLLSIKQKYDPNHLLDCWHCVGWKGAQDPRYKCYPNTTAGH